MRITIVGDGGWGTALGLLLRQYGRDVTVWGPFADYVNEVRQRRENARFMPGVGLPPEIRWTADPAEACAGAGMAVLAVPSPFFADVCRRFCGVLPADVPVVSVTKGLDPATHRRMSAIAAAALGARRVAVLSGPSLAGEVARGLPTAVVAAAADEALAVQVQRLFSGPRFRVYTSTDPVGVELGGVVKNVIAIAAGVSDGLGFGDNTRAALITRRLAEMTRLACSLGARAETLSGLSCMGDLIVTCNSRQSRNRGVGERLGRGEKLGDILSGMRMVAEGVPNCRLVVDLAAEHGIDVPISAQVCAICHGGQDPQQALISLMGRESKPEHGRRD